MTKTQNWFWYERYAIVLQQRGPWWDRGEYFITVTDTATGRAAYSSEDREQALRQQIDSLIDLMQKLESQEG